MEPDQLLTSSSPAAANGTAPVATDAVHPGVSPETVESNVAPRRAMRLVARPVLENTAVALRAVAAVPSTPLASLDPFLNSRTHPVSPLERKLAGVHDAGQMLQTLDTELHLQRAKRLHSGEGSRLGMRALALAMFFALLIAALGAMSYLQSKLAQSGFHRHADAPAAVTTTAANPAPSPSAPVAVPAR